MFEQIFKNIDDRLHKDAGSSSELDYVEQSSWILFLKYLADFEKDKENEAKLQGKEYENIIDLDYRWGTWAYPLDKNGNLEINKVLTGDDLINFVDNKLFPYLKSLRAKATSPSTIEYKIGEVFSELRNKIQSGYTLRDVLDEVNKLKFQSSKDKHELSHLYESKIKNMGNAGRNGGEYYTPRPLIRAMVRVVDPKIGETVYDGAVGSAGFLCEAFEYMKSKDLTAKDLEILQTKTFFGKELKSLAYIIGIMNMILHGIEAPNILHTNTLAQNINDIQEKDRYNIVLTNPPFGAGIRSEIQQNFPIKSGETAYLFLQHFIKSLKVSGRAAIVIKNTFLSNTDNASVSLRKLLLESCNLKTILDCPSGTFIGAGVKTVVLFFEKGIPTREIWYYQLNPGRNLGKTNPLNDADLIDFIELQKQFSDSPNSWKRQLQDIDPITYDLSVKNPNTILEIEHKNPIEIIDELKKLDQENEDILNEIRKLI
jgi:type I restriction enzyme M protein